MYLLVAVGGDDPVCICLVFEVEASVVGVLVEHLFELFAPLLLLHLLVLPSIALFQTIFDLDSRI